MNNTNCKGTGILTDRVVYNTYVENSMLPENKIAVWHTVYKNSKGNNIHIPIVGVGLIYNTFTTECQELAFSLGKEQFSCHQCGVNCKEIFKIFGRKKYVLCNHARLTTRYSTELSDLSNRLYTYATSSPERFTLKIATESLLAKDKYNFEDTTRGRSHDTMRPFLHYAGNCDTLDDVELNDVRIRTLGGALQQYWEPMYKLLSSLTEKWNKAGQRHATLQRITSIEEVTKDVSTSQDHLKKTLIWIGNILRTMTKPITMYDMSDRVQIVIEAIAQGDIGEMDSGSGTILHSQYSVMNNIIMKWMTCIYNRRELQVAITDLCGENKIYSRDIRKKYCSNCSAPLGTRSTYVCPNCSTLI
tara:strand:- start:1751 stop:2827 length:1077 start_codon:yes stop_codon:yes gene_type:complete